MPTSPQRDGLGLRRQTVAAVLAGAPVRSLTLVAGGLGATTLATYVAGGTQTAVPQLGHLFVVTAATSMGAAVGAATGLAAGLLLGPWMPLNVQMGMPQTPESWILRTIVFLLVGTITGALSRGLRDLDTAFRDTLTDLPVAVTVATGSEPAATITYANAATTALVGDITGTTLAELFDRFQARSSDGDRVTVDDIASAPTAVARRGTATVFQVTDIRGVRRTVRLRAIRAGSGHTVAVIDDLTSRARFEQSRRHVITLAGHHLRTPLTPLLGFSKLITRRAAEIGDPTIEQYSQVVERNVARLHGLVERLSQLAQLDAAPENLYRSVRVADLVTTAIERLDADETDIHLRVKRDTTAQIAPSHVQAALAELLTNALTHGSPPIIIDIDRTDRHVIVRIADAGPGLPDHTDLDAAFEPYAGMSDHPETDAPRGHGLGLALARAHCQATGADLRYDPDSRAFICLLPATSHQ